MELKKKPVFITLSVLFVIVFLFFTAGKSFAHNPMINNDEPAVKSVGMASHYEGKVEYVYHGHFTSLQKIIIGVSIIGGITGILFYFAVRKHPRKESTDN